MPGLYFYDRWVAFFAKALKPSGRGENEITDLDRTYLEMGQVKVQQLGRRIAWLDAGTHEALLQAANFIQAVQERQGIMISCLKEIAHHMGYISLRALKDLARAYQRNSYGDYLDRLAESELT